MMTLIYIVIGISYVFLSVIVNMKINIGSRVREEFSNEQWYREEVVTSETKKFFMKNFFEVALMPNSLSNIIILIQLTYFFLLGFIFYKGEWIWGICYFLIVLTLSILLERSRQLRHIIVLMFYRELSRKSLSNKLNSAEKFIIHKMIELFDSDILQS